MGVFPTVDLSGYVTHGLPHTRGGVSAILENRENMLESSPHTWGCFSLNGAIRAFYFVFPTHVGVFLTGKAFASHAVSLPHTRGGVSQHNFHNNS